MEQNKLDKFFSLLFFTELLCSGKSPESRKIHKYLTNTFNTAMEIIKDCVETKNVKTYHRVINAIQELDLSKKETTLSPERREFAVCTYKRFAMRVGDLLQQDVVFLQEYNTYLTVFVKNQQKNKTK